MSYYLGLLHYQVNLHYIFENRQTGQSIAYDPMRILEILGHLPTKKLEIEKLQIDWK